MPLPAFNIRRGGSFSAVLEGGELRHEPNREDASNDVAPHCTGLLLLSPWALNIAAMTSGLVAAADSRLCCAATATETGAFGAAMLFDLAVGRMLSPGGGGWPAVIKVSSVSDLKYRAMQPAVHRRDRRGSVYRPSPRCWLFV